MPFLRPPLLQLSAVVAEREKGLRQALKTMGMLESCEQPALLLHNSQPSPAH